MTISSTTVKNSYSGNGTLDTFNYTFKIFANADVQVIIRDASATETVKTLTTHYTVTGAGSASGGTIVFTSGNIPSATETVVIRRASPQTQAIDYIANDPFPAESHEEGLDRSMMAVQQLQEEVDRSIKLSRTNTMTSTEFSIGDTDRAGKVFGFDSAGELVVTQELGTFKGNWSASTTFAVRDIIKDTSNNNIYLCKTAHTSSGSQPISSNTDVAKWDLLVDAASATTAATTATTQAGIATTKASEASASASAALTSENNAETAETNAETAEANAVIAKNAAVVAQTAAEAALDNFDDKFLGAKASDPTLDNDGDALTDGALYFNTTDDVMKVYDLSNTTWRQIQLSTSDQANVNIVAADLDGTDTIGTVAGSITNVNTVAGNNTNINTVAGISANVTSVAGISSNVTAVAGNETNINEVNSNSSNINAVASNQTNINSVASNSANITSVAGNETNINAVNANSTNINLVAGDSTEINAVAGDLTSINTAATNLADINAFANIYLGPQSSAPTLDPDGSALDVGDLYFDTTSQTMKVYSSSGWIPAGSSVNGTADRFYYVATAGQTSFSGADENGNTLAYDAGYIDIYLNGVKLVNGVDVTVTSGSAIVLATGATVGDSIDIIAYGTFDIANVNATNITSGTLNIARLADDSITNAKLDNNSITINGSTVSLGGSTSIVTTTYPIVSSITPDTITNAQTSITITGSNFVSVPQVEFINPSTGIWYVADTVTFNNSTSLTVQTTLTVDAQYKIRIENPDGASVLSGTILTVSDAPTWNTAAGDLGTFAGDFSGTLATLSATSDSAITYSEVGSNLTTANVTLNTSTGALTTTDFGGSSTTATTYNFTIRATDAENQTADRSFSLTSSFGATGGGQFN